MTSDKLKSSSNSKLIIALVIGLVLGALIGGWWMHEYTKSYYEKTQEIQQLIETTEPSDDK